MNPEQIICLTSNNDFRSLLLLLYFTQANRMEVQSVDMNKANADAQVSIVCLYIM